MTSSSAACRRVSVSHETDQRPRGESWPSRRWWIPRLTMNTCICNVAFDTSKEKKTVERLSGGKMSRETERCICWNDEFVIHVWGGVARNRTLYRGRNRQNLSCAFERTKLKKSSNFDRHCLQWEKPLSLKKNTERTCRRWDMLTFIVKIPHPSEIAQHSRRWHHKNDWSDRRLCQVNLSGQHKPLKNTSLV